jgi:xylulokinase
MTSRCTETMVSSFTPDYLSTYLSLCPSMSDSILSFGPMDIMLTPAQHYIPTRLYHLFPHPAQDPGEKRRYIAMLTNRLVLRFLSPRYVDIVCHRNADVPRALVRDMYTKSWSAFDRLVAIVPPGGSIGYICIAHSGCVLNVHSLGSTTSYSVSGFSRVMTTLFHI